MNISREMLALGRVSYSLINASEHQKLEAEVRSAERARRWYTCEPRTVNVRVVVEFEIGFPFAPPMQTRLARVGETLEDVTESAARLMGKKVEIVDTSTAS